MTTRHEKEAEFRFLRCDLKSGENCGENCLEEDVSFTLSAEPDREITQTCHQEALLHAYLGNMVDLLLHGTLHNSAEDDEVRAIAREWTLTVLPRLDPRHKKSVLQFLQTSGLLDKDKRIIDLTRADLCQVNLSRANLAGIDLHGADLFGASFRETDLHGANLSGANLMFANFSGANLTGTNLSGANLVKANLSGADLSQADLSGAYLEKGVR